MCYNLESSIYSFTIAVRSSYLMYRRNNKLDKFNYPLIFAYSFVQLGEAFMWYDLNCGNLNKLGGYIAYYSLASHVFAMGVSLYLINKNSLGIILGILTLIYLTYNLPSINCSKTENNLEWGFNPQYYTWVYILVLVLAFIIKINYKYKIILFILYNSLLLYFFHNKFNIINIHKFFKYNRMEVATLWCNAASLSSPLIYLLGYVNL